MNLAGEKAAESPISDAREDHEGIACILIVTSNPIIKSCCFRTWGILVHSVGILPSVYRKKLSFLACCHTKRMV